MVSLTAWFPGTDEDWERPGPTPRERRSDVILAAGWLATAALGTEFLRSMGEMDELRFGVGWQYAAVVTACLLLVWRRSHPLTVAAAASVHMLAVGITMPIVMAALPMQVLYFFALFTGVAWARDRRLMSFVVVGILVVMFAWLTWVFAVSSGAASFYGRDPVPDAGLFSAVIAASGYVAMSNIIFFGGAIVLGQAAWRAALRTAQVVEQAETIRRQTDQLRDQAVVAERLRIARELHDVVAHHVSVMGVQAAAARRVLTRDPEAARESLGAVEASSRQAVGQMRELLGTLRSGELVADGSAAADHAGGAGRAPQPRLSDIPDLVAQARTPLCEVAFTLVEAEPGVAARVAAPVQLSAYRVIQESLANIRKHSTATTASVVVRVGAHVEVEVLDNGRPRHGTSGSGLGQLGMRERAHHLGGSADIGPRHGGGYRVRVRFPLEPAPPPADTGAPGSAREPEQVR